LSLCFGTQGHNCKRYCCVFQVTYSFLHKFTLHFSASFGQSEHFQKRIITLDGCGINSAGPDGEIATTCPNIEELDLAKNDLSDFQEVGNKF